MCFDEGVECWGIHPFDESDVPGGDHIGNEVGDAGRDLNFSWLFWSKAALKISWLLRLIIGLSRTRLFFVGST